MTSRRRSRTVPVDSGYGLDFLKKESHDLIQRYSEQKKKSLYFEKYGIPTIIFVLILILLLKYIFMVI